MNLGSKFKIGDIVELDSGKYSLSKRGDLFKVISINNTESLFCEVFCRKLIQYRDHQKYKKSYKYWAGDMKIATAHMREIKLKELGI